MKHKNRNRFMNSTSLINNVTLHFCNKLQFFFMNNFHVTNEWFRAPYQTSFFIANRIYGGPLEEYTYNLSFRFIKFE